MKNRIFISIIILIFFFTINLQSKENFNSKKLDNYFYQLEKNNKLMGSVFISKDGRKIYKKSIGYSSIEDGISLKNNNLTKFRIGSITKLFTATIIFQLIDEGKLDLKTKLSKFFPEVINSKTITISNLLSHRSGIHSFTSNKEFYKYMTLKKSKNEMMEIISKLKSNFKPDKKFEYSNTNYVLLGYIIEKITKKSYKIVLKDRITTKLNLTGTYYGSEIDPYNNEAFSYRYYGNKWVYQIETNMSIPHGAGAIVSTAKDLSVFITALFNNKLISRKSFAQMKKTRNNYGKGLMLFSFKDKKAYGHNGGIDYFISNLMYFPKEKVVISIITNGLNYSFNDIQIAIKSIYFNYPFKIPNFNFKLSKKDLKKYEGVFSSDSLPLEIALQIKGNILTGRASGQTSFPLKAFSKTIFKFNLAGIKLVFSKDKDGKILHNSFVLHQKGKKHLYKKLKNAE